MPDGERILTWRHLYDLEELPSHLVVVGSGVTGAEFVSAYTEMGVKVTLVSSRDRVMPHEDADAALVLEDVLAERGVTLVKHARADAVERTEDGGIVVKLSDGRTVHGSHALMAVGSTPNTEGLGLEKVGIELGQVATCASTVSRGPRSPASTRPGTARACCRWPRWPRCRVALRCTTRWARA